MKFAAELIDHLRMVENASTAALRREVYRTKGHGVRHHAGGGSFAAVIRNRYAAVILKIAHKAVMRAGVLREGDDGS